MRTNLAAPTTTSDEDARNGRIALDLDWLQPFLFAALGYVSALLKDLVPKIFEEPAVARLRAKLIPPSKAPSTGVIYGPNDKVVHEFAWRTDSGRYLRLRRTS